MNATDLLKAMMIRHLDQRMQLRRDDPLLSGQMDMLIFATSFVTEISLEQAEESVCEEIQEWMANQN